MSETRNNGNPVLAVALLVGLFVIFRFILRVAFGLIAAIANAVVSPNRRPAAPHVHNQEV